MEGGITLTSEDVGRTTAFWLSLYPGLLFLDVNCGLEEAVLTAGVPGLVPSTEQEVLLATRRGVGTR